MNLHIDNTTCEDIIFNEHNLNNYLEKLYYNDSLVWSKTNGRDYAIEPLTFEALGSGSIQIAPPMSRTGGGEDKTLEYSKDSGSTWTSLTVHVGTQYINSSSVAWFEIPVASGDIVQVRTSLYDWNGQDKSKWYNFPHVKATCDYKIYGNIESIFTGSSFLANANKGRALCYMFQEDIGVTYIFTGYPQKGDSPSQFFNTNVNSHLIDASNLVMRIGGAWENKYGANEDINPAISMFAGCQKLLAAPRRANVAINANYRQGTNVAGSQCNSMFSRCINLKSCDWNIDYIDGGFTGMFSWCMSLEIAPQMIRSWYLPGYGITTLKVLNKTLEEFMQGSTSNSNKLMAGNLSKGIDSMFENCVSLKKGPVIIGRNIGNWTNNTDGKDGSNMFFNCQSLEEIMIYNCDWEKRDMSTTLMNYSYNTDPFDLGSVTGRTSVVTKGTWSSNSSSLGPLTIYSNFNKSGWNNNQYITTVKSPENEDVVRWYCNGQKNILSY